MRAVVLVLAVLLAGCGEAPAAPVQEPAPVEPALPEPDGPLPRDAAAFASQMEDVSARLRVVVRRWVDEGDTARGGPPEDVELLALRQQRLTLRLAERPRFSGPVLRRLPARLRARVRDEVLARRELGAIHSVVTQRPRIRVGRAQPAGVLRSHYRRAWRRFRVGWPLLAAVNMVESQFGRLRNESVSGARGPMQFMPATWAAYGMGGNVRDPRDAILGAANYLHANGAPGDEARALYHYNPSRLYVSAVGRYTRQIRRDPLRFYEYYAWGVFVRGRRVVG